MHVSVNIVSKNDFILIVKYINFETCKRGPPL